MIKTKRQLFLGVDGGGSKTRAVIADEYGKILADVRGGASNFQFLGTKIAVANTHALLQKTMRRAKAGASEFKAAFYGMAGADRISDQRHIRKWLTPISPAKKFRLAADPIPMIRLASPDGSGIAAVAGTGGNCIGVDASGKECSVGGWIGSWVGGGDIGHWIINLCVEAQDGRGLKTLMADLLCKKYKLKEPTDMLDWVYTDAPKGRRIDNVELAPIAFEAAAKGDAVARRLLQAQGHEMFRMAAQVRKTLFSACKPIVVAMGGSLLQRAQPPLIRKTFEKEFKAFHSKVSFVTPDKDPAYGALLLAYDLVGVPAPEKELLGEKI